jgi:hypothetical protein
MNDLQSKFISINEFYSLKEIDIRLNAFKSEIYRILYDHGLYLYYKVDFIRDSLNTFEIQFTRSQHLNIKVMFKMDNKMEGNINA